LGEPKANQDFAGAGVDRIADDKGRVLYIGESLDVAKRLRDHRRRQWQAESPIGSVATVVPAPAKYQLHELECELIAGHFDEKGVVPVMQFMGGRTADGLDS
jgi:hypothetical protein